MTFIMIKKTKDGEIDFSRLWSQQIFRSQVGEKQYIFALVKRKYGPNDVETTGPGEYIGIEQKPTYKMTTDTNPDSETYNERVPEEQSTFSGSGQEIKVKIQTGTTWENNHEVSKKMLENYRSTVGNMPKPLGETQLYWILKEGKYQANDINDFFEMDMKDVRETLVKSKSIRNKKGKKVEVEEDAQEQ